jgi:hypothetical protein
MEVEGRYEPSYVRTTESERRDAGGRELLSGHDTPIPKRRGPEASRPPGPESRLADGYFANI